MAKKARTKCGLPRLESKTQAQHHYIQNIKTKTVTFGIGSAGVGKTFCSSVIAGDLLYHKRVDRIIITRPAVEAEEKLGFLPGTLEEKFAPYLVPIEDIFISRYGKNWYESQLKNGNIWPVPLGHMQGLTFDNSFVIFDEAQNSTPNQMFMILSRIGINCKMVINGDYKMQKMLRGLSGLEDAQNKLQNVEGIAFYEFTSDDCIRSGMAREIIKRYEGEI